MNVLSPLAPITHCRGRKIILLFLSKNFSMHLAVWKRRKIILLLLGFKCLIMSQLWRRRSKFLLQIQTYEIWGCRDYIEIFQIKLKQIKLKPSQTKAQQTKAQQTKLNSPKYFKGFEISKSAAQLLYSCMDTYLFQQLTSFCYSWFYCFQKFISCSSTSPHPFWMNVWICTFSLPFRVIR